MDVTAIAGVLTAAAGLIAAVAALVAQWKHANGPAHASPPEPGSAPSNPQATP